MFRNRSAAMSIVAVAVERASECRTMQVGSTASEMVANRRRARPADVCELIKYLHDAGDVKDVVI